MLNRKFASIRANVKIDKRNSVTPSANQRMSQSQSMDMQSNYLRNQSVNNNILLNMSKEAAARSMSHDRRVLDFDPSPLSTPVRSPIMKATPPHPYVNLMHQQQNFNNVSPYQLQYQSHIPMANQFAPDGMSQSFNQNSAPGTPVLTHYTAAQIYMRPKVAANAYGQLTSSVPSLNSKKPPPPEVPKRLSSSISVGSTSSLKKTNGLSRSSEFSLLNLCVLTQTFNFR